MATIDPEDVERITDIIDQWDPQVAPDRKWMRGAAEIILIGLADRLLPRDADVQERRFHRTAGTGVEYPCATVDCLVPVTRRKFTALWSVSS